MEQSVTLTAKFLTVNGKRAGIRICAGPWIGSIPAELITIRCRAHVFPAEFRSALAVTNNSDMQTDYFEADTIHLMPGHPLYEKAAAIRADGGAE